MSTVVLATTEPVSTETLWSHIFMEPSEVRRASDAARRTAVGLGIQVDQAVVVHNSDRLAVRLLPGDLLTRIAPASWRAGMQFEAEVARRLAEIGSPVGVLDPRVGGDVHVRDGFAMTFWKYYESVGDLRTQQHLGMVTSIGPADYARALARLHADLRQIDLPAPHVTDRVAGWIEGVETRELTPELPDRDRDLLSATLRRVSAAISSEGSGEQLLHGEPHPGNVLETAEGPIWIDVGTVQRGPVEYDLAYAPEEVAEHYPGARQGLVRMFRILMWAGIATMRWYDFDQYPRRDYWRTESLRQLREALDRHGVEESTGA